MNTSRRLLIAPLLAAALLAAGCGDDEDAGQEGATSTSEAAPSEAGCPPVQPPVDAEVPAEITERGKPTVTVPAEPAAELGVTDIVEGTGEEVRQCAAVVAHYVGVGQQSGQEFDSSWDRGQPIGFPLGGVIAGWQEGLLGMKVGGRRELVIPGSQAYGPNPPSPEIQPNETLVFVVDLVAVTNADS